jgi:hypothetical protein
MAETPKILEIEMFPDMFYLWLQGDNRIWEAIDDGPEEFIVTEYIDGEEGDERWMEYEDFHTKDIYGLICRLARFPEDTLEDLIGEHHKIKEVRIISKVDQE